MFRRVIEFVKTLQIYLPTYSIVLISIVLCYILWCIQCKSTIPTTVVHFVFVQFKEYFLCGWLESINQLTPTLYILIYYSVLPNKRAEGEGGWLENFGHFPHPSTLKKLKGHARLQNCQTFYSSKQIKPNVTSIRQHCSTIIIY